MTEKLELRMYGLVPYNISPIQQGIQYGHAVVEYTNKYFGDEEYQKWSKVDKTFIILNGGTTNNNESQLGTMNQYLQTLVDNEIKIETFHEPDLGNQLTAIVFLVDERVFNRIKYPDFETSVLGALNTWKYKREYKGWIKKIGGEKNVFLRDFLKNFRLA
jgi:hypothetical protein